MVSILCDTSFLIVLASRPVKNLNVLESSIGKIDFVVPTVVIDELKHLVRIGSVKRANSARLALELAKNFKTIAIDGRSADGAIVDYTSKRRCYVATVDIDLKNKLKRNGISVITLVQDRIMLA